MNKCKNPECRKEIDENRNYCNEDCLRRHQAIKKEYIENVKKEEKNSIESLTDKQKEAITTSQDFNANLILKAVETKTEITLFPRRSHTIRGIPILYDSSTCRVYVNTGRTIETVLLSEIGHFSFPLTLLQ
jgi:hypothetical protein